MVRSLAIAALNVDYYQTLGVERTATPEEIKKAYKRMVKKHHPDRAASDEERVARNKSMVAINRAYEALIDPKKRAWYDAHGEEAPRDTIEAQALQVIFQILLQFINSGPESFDFLQPLRVQLQENKRTIQAGKAKLEREMRKTEKQRKCVRRKAAKDGKPAENLLDRLFQQKIDQCTKQIAAIPEALKIADKAIEILKDYETVFVVEQGAVNINLGGGLAGILGRGF